MPWPPRCVSRVPRFLLAIETPRLQQIATCCGADGENFTSSASLAKAVIAQLVQNGRGPEELLGPLDCGGFTDQELRSALRQLRGIDESRVEQLFNKDVCRIVLAYWTQVRRAVAGHDSATELLAWLWADHLP